MSQSSVILATLLAGFVCFLALNGKLQTYWTLLAGGGSSASGAAGAAGAGETSNTPAGAGGLLSNFGQLPSELVGAFDPSAFLSAGSSLAALGAF